MNKTPTYSPSTFGRINFATMSSRRTTLVDLFDECKRGHLLTVRQAVRQAVADGFDLKNARDDRYSDRPTPLHYACWYVSTLHPLQ